MSEKAANNARVLEIDPDGKTAEIEFVDQHGETVIGVYMLAGWSWAPAAERARAEEVLRRPPLVIYGRDPRNPRLKKPQ